MKPDCEKCLADIFSAQNKKDEETLQDISSLTEDIQYMTAFLADLKNNPPFWRRTYKKKISKFCDSIGL